MIFFSSVFFFFFGLSLSFPLLLDGADESRALPPLADSDTAAAEAAADDKVFLDVETDFLTCFFKG
jgi:hypothetical protein